MQASKVSSGTATHHVALPLVTHCAAAGVWIGQYTVIQSTYIILCCCCCSGWLKAVFTVSDAFVLRSAGLDALVRRLQQHHTCMNTAQQRLACRTWLCSRRGAQEQRAAGLQEQGHRQDVCSSNVLHVCALLKLAIAGQMRMTAPGCTVRSGTGAAGSRHGMPHLHAQ
jgi:hypothetical protein